MKKEKHGFYKHHWYFMSKSQSGVGISAFIFDVNEDVPVNKKVNNNA